MTNQRHSCFKCYLKLLGNLAVALFLLGVTAYLARAPLLTAFTHAWVVDEGRVPADAVVVFGGGRNTRPFAAAQAYHDGLVMKVLVPDILREPIEDMGLKTPESEINRQVVLREGVPESAIEFYGDQVSSTWEEAQALKEWCVANQAKTLLCPTEFPFTRRLNWVLDRVLGDSGTQAHVYPIEALHYEQKSWWTHEYGLIDMQNDFIKYLLYRVKY